MLDDDQKQPAGQDRWSLRRLKRVEWLLVGAITVMLVVLIIPSVEWASSGSLRVPVRVFVFDAAHAVPISNARVTIFRGPLPSTQMDIKSIGDRVPDELSGRLPRDRVVFTGSDGMAVVHHEFRTGASHRRPESHAHTQSVWIVVVTRQHGTVVVPIRHDSMPTSKLREQQELFVPIGLMLSS